MKNNLAFTKTDKIMQIHGSILFMVKYMVVKAKIFSVWNVPQSSSTQWSSNNQVIKYYNKKRSLIEIPSPSTHRVYIKY